MTMKNTLKYGALAILLAVAPTTVHAAKTTVNDITLDVPAGYKVSSSKRGVLVKTPDGEVDVWVETFLGAETKKLLSEHASYWHKEKVELGDATTSKENPATPMSRILPFHMPPGKVTPPWYDIQP